MPRDGPQETSIADLVIDAKRYQTYNLCLPGCRVSEFMKAKIGIPVVMAGWAFAVSDYVLNWLWTAVCVTHHSLLCSRGA